MIWQRAYTVFVVTLILVYAVLAFPGFEPFPRLTAKATASVLDSVGIKSAVVGKIIVTEGFSPLNVTAECSGIILVFVFILTIHLLPVMRFSRKLGSLMLIPAIFLGNVLRLVMSVMIGQSLGADAMRFYHFSIGQIFVFAWTIALYIAWLKVLDMFPGEEFSRPLLGIK
jgi:exosortase/archaeosortase family protein